MTLTRKNQAVIWGAGNLGRACSGQLALECFDVLCFLDKNPPAAGQLDGIPVYDAMEVLDRRLEGIREVDIVFLAFLSSKFIPVRQLRAAGYTGKIVSFAEGQSIGRLLTHSLDGSAGADQALAHDPNLHIYPMDIPEIRVNPNLDMLLLELPPRQIPMMPYGLAHVHNLLKTTGIVFQTLDVNMILYHRYYSGLYIRGAEPPCWAQDMDPWDPKNVSRWAGEALDYFHDDLEELVNQIVSQKPKMLGVSIHNSNMTLARNVLARVRERYPDVVVIIGGYACVYREIALFDLKVYDYIVMREAELTFPPLIENLKKGIIAKDLPGILSRYDSADRKWRDGPLPVDLDAIPFPSYDWTDLACYRLESGATATPISISRGCRWGRCNFCAERFRFRTRDPLIVVDEIEWHVRQGFSNFISMESDINGDQDTLVRLCREIIRRNLKVSLFGQLRIDPDNDLDFFRLLKNAGFSSLVFGVDGWCDHVLYLQRKGYTMKSVVGNLENCRKAGIASNVNMIVGVPGETEKDVDESIGNIIAQRDNIHLFTTINMVRLVHGSPYYADPEKFNIRFVGEKASVYLRDPHIIDERLWFSVEPYIDHKIRSDRYMRVCRGLIRGGVNIGDWAKWENTLELKRMSGQASDPFDKTVFETV